MDLDGSDGAALILGGGAHGKGNWYGLESVR